MQILTIRGHVVVNIDKFTQQKNNVLLEWRLQKGHWSTQSHTQEWTNSLAPNFENEFKPAVDANDTGAVSVFMRVNSVMQILTIRSHVVVKVMFNPWMLRLKLYQIFPYLHAKDN